MIREIYDGLLEAVVVACRQCYGDRLVSIAVFGSVGRGTPRPDSDVDLLLVVRHLAAGRPERAAEFTCVEKLIALALDRAKAAGVHTEISPIFKTPQEVALGSPLFLDMVEDARILHDEGSLLADAFAALRDRLRRLGARRIWKGSAWIWDLKPDYKPGDVFDL